MKEYQKLRIHILKNGCRKRGLYETICLQYGSTSKSGIHLCKDTILKTAKLIK